MKVGTKDDGTVKTKVREPEEMEKERMKETKTADEEKHKETTSKERKKKSQKAILRVAKGVSLCFPNG